MSARTTASYPKLATKSWWLVRKRFVESIPPAVTSSYLASLLHMELESAATNVLVPLRTMGIVDEKGVPTERAKRWREDDLYQEVCDEILRDVYPAEIRSLYDDPGVKRADVESWFRKNADVGKGAAASMARVYLLLLSGDPSKGKSVSSSPTRQNGKKEIETLTPLTDGSNGVAHEPTTNPTAATHVNNTRPNIPTVHVDLQIHVSPEASSEQIDKLFESIAKHVYQVEAE